MGNLKFEMINLIRLRRASVYALLRRDKKSREQKAESIRLRRASVYALLRRDKKSKK
jgi:hypothetical protein